MSYKIHKVLPNYIIIIIIIITTTTTTTTTNFAGLALIAST
jgi:hypothetical protein